MSTYRGLQRASVWRALTWFAEVPKVDQGLDVLRRLLTARAPKHNVRAKGMSMKPCPDCLVPTCYVLLIIPVIVVIGLIPIIMMFLWFPLISAVADSNLIIVTITVTVRSISMANIVSCNIMSLLYCCFTDIVNVERVGCD